MIKKAIKTVFAKFGYTVVHLKKKSNITTHNIFGIQIDLTTHGFLLKGKVLLQHLVNKRGATLNIEAGKVIIKFQDFQFYINTWEEILILHEVFIEGVYNFNSSKDYLLIDVGMNVGITSIFHSNNINCKKIVSFEPFVATMEMAIKNFSLNKNAKKITPVNTGLGYPARKLHINYSAEYKGSVGINGIASYVKENDDLINTETLEIIDVHETLKSVFIKNTHLQKVMKIDAEGVEYEIIERLSNTGLINEIDFIMIEWHVKGSIFIEKILKQQGFEILSFNTLDKNIGMIYAFNSKVTA